MNSEVKKKIEFDGMRNALLNTIIDGMTNGDVIMAMFPNWEYKESAVKIGYSYNHHIDCYVTKTWVVSFNKDWWYAPYKENKG